MIVKHLLRRGVNKKWVMHLTNGEDNERVNVVDIRGTPHDDVGAALRSMAARAVGTQCKAPLFEVIFAPDEITAELHFQSGVEKIEAAYPGLKDQPRIVIEHEKNGVKHQHVIWGRCSHDRPTVNLPFTKIRTGETAYALFLERGVEPPQGLKDFMAGRSHKDRAPSKDIPSTTWRQIERAGLAPKDFTAFVRAAWQGDDFAATMKNRGYSIARGDRRGFVAVDMNTGEVFGLSQLLKPVLGVTAKDMRAVLGQESEYPSIAQRLAEKKENAPELAPVTPPQDSYIAAQKEKLESIKDRQRADELVEGKKLQAAQKSGLKSQAEIEMRRNDLEVKHRQERAGVLSMIKILKQGRTRFNFNQAGIVAATVAAAVKQKADELAMFMDVMKERWFKPPSDADVARVLAQGQAPADPLLAQAQAAEQREQARREKLLDDEGWPVEEEPLDWDAAEKKQAEDYARDQAERRAADIAYDEEQEQKRLRRAERRRQREQEERDQDDGGRDRGDEFDDDIPPPPTDYPQR